MATREELDRTAALPWNKIAREYISGVSLSQLSKKYGVGEHTIHNRVKKGNWQEKREQARLESATKIKDSVVSIEVERAAKIKTAADKLLDLITRGLDDGSLGVTAKSLRDISGALKDIQDIHGIKNEEQVKEIIVKLGGAEEYAE